MHLKFSESWKNNNEDSSLDIKSSLNLNLRSTQVYTKINFGNKNSSIILKIIPNISSQLPR